LVCKGICIRYRVNRDRLYGHYAVGHKRCMLCEIFMKWNGLWCPCCGYRLRSLPRNSKYKDSHKEKKDEVKFMLEYLKEHDPELYSQFVSD